MRRVPRPGGGVLLPLLGILLVGAGVAAGAYWFSVLGVLLLGASLAYKSGGDPGSPSLFWLGGFLILLAALGAGLLSSRQQPGPMGSPPAVTPGFTIPLEPAGANPLAPTPFPGPNTPESGEIPCTTHVVVAGDTLYAIARLYGDTVAGIAERNNLADPNKIQVGQALTVCRVPAGRG